MTEVQAKPFYILSLDGGGSLGVYTLGVLEKVEGLVGMQLCDKFDLIYGTSTGSIIGSLLALGKSIFKISQIYFDYIPHIMNPVNNSNRRSKALMQCAKEIFGSDEFNQEKIQTLRQCLEL